jgi:hypothetical protein
LLRLELEQIISSLDGHYLIFLCISRVLSGLSGDILFHFKDFTLLMENDNPDVTLAEDRKSFFSVNPFHKPRKMRKGTIHGH